MRLNEGKRSRRPKGGSCDGRQHAACAPLDQHDVPSDPRVQLVATPVDMRAVAAKASVSVVPSPVGGGTRLKILDSRKWGLPVVSTVLGCTGLAPTDREHVVIRDRPDAFAEPVVGLLSDAVVWRRLSEAGRARVERRYRWDLLFEQFEVELDRLVRAPGGSTNGRKNLS